MLVMQMVQSHLMGACDRLLLCNTARRITSRRLALASVCVGYNAWRRFIGRRIGVEVKLYDVILMQMVQSHLMSLSSSRCYSMDMRSVYVIPQLTDHRAMVPGSGLGVESRKGALIVEQVHTYSIATTRLIHRSRAPAI